MEKTKQEIRKECRNARMALSECEVEEASRRAAGFLLKDADYRKAETILAYIDTQQEISTRAILEDAWRCGKTTAVPRVEGKTMEFYQITSYEDLEPGHFGVWEPKVHCRSMRGLRPFFWFPVWPSTGRDAASDTAEDSMTVIWRSIRITTRSDTHTRFRSMSTFRRKYSTAGWIVS